MAMAVIMFSFGGLELVGITAAEADNSRRSIPKATNQVIYRILIFYIGALAVLMSLYPWGKVVEGGSPFVMIFHALDSNLRPPCSTWWYSTAALSVYNSCVHCNSRMLFGLAKQGNGPRSLLKTNKSGVPVVAISVSAAATLLCVLINYLMPGKAFELLMALVVSALVINWAMISLAHLKFRKSKQAEGVVPKFKAFWYPFGNYLCLTFMAGILVIMYLTPGIQIRYCSFRSGSSCWPSAINSSRSVRLASQPTWADGCSPIVLKSRSLTGFFYPDITAASRHPRLPSSVHHDAVSTRSASGHR